MATIELTEEEWAEIVNILGADEIFCSDYTEIKTKILNQLPKPLT